MAPASQGKKEQRKRIGAAVLSLLALALCLAPSHAQGPAGDTTCTRQTFFRIPFDTDPGERRLQQVELYVSADEGRSWHYVASVPPERRGFDFRAERDGLYWFTVRTIDLQGRPYPATVDGAQPLLKVAVDTQPPSIMLRALPAQDGVGGVEWDIRDDNLDLSTFRLEVRLPGGNDWVPVQAEPSATGRRTWNAAAAGIAEVRLRVRDRADNAAEAKTSLTPGAPDSRLPAGQGTVHNAPPAGPPMRLVNSTRISLNYEVKDVGPSGSIVELWIKKEGQKWQKHDTVPNQSPCVITVSEEGRYGFTLVAKSGVGLGDRPPQEGDPPQVWVEVDLTKPTIRLINVDVGRGPDAGRMTISWSASDKNLAQQPVTLSYAAERGGSWTPIASNLESSGRYVWQVPRDGVRFLVRAEAVDKAGNVGADETREPVIVDLSQPKGLILGVEPALK
jgi:hypothetical protein